VVVVPLDGHLQQPVSVLVRQLSLKPKQEFLEDLIVRTEEQVERSLLRLIASYQLERNSFLCSQTAANSKLSLGNCKPFFAGHEQTACLAVECVGNLDINVVAVDAAELPQSDDLLVDVRNIDFNVFLSKLLLLLPSDLKVDGSGDGEDSSSADEERVQGRDLPVSIGFACRPEVLACRRQQFHADGGLAQLSVVERQVVGYNVIDSLFLELEREQRGEAL
jgi:hypothetical protein